MSDHEGLAQGRFGDAGLIVRQSAGWYVAQGVPRAVAEGGRLHPYVDFLAAQRFRGFPAAHDPADFAEPPPFESVLSWLDDDHPGDSPLELEFSHRLECMDLALADDQAPMRAILQQADGWLAESIPALWAQTRPFVTRARLVRSDTLAGLSWHDMDGLFFLGDTKARDPHLVAESMLHEALHSKAARLSRAFRDPFQTATREFIEIPWWRTATSSRMWSTVRTFDAFYVYSHLGAYYQARRRLVGTDETRPLERISFRTAYLYNVLRQLDGSWLDDERRALVEWLYSHTPRPSRLSPAGRQLLEIDIRSFDDAEALDEQPIAALAD